MSAKIALNFLGAGVTATGAAAVAVGIGLGVGIAVGISSIGCGIAYMMANTDPNTSDGNGKKLN